MSRLERRKIKNGLLFCSPWILGFLGLQVYPIFYSFFLSLTEYSGFGSMTFIGLENYRTLFRDEFVALATANTLIYTAMAVPIGIVVALIMALAMNQKVKEVAVYRAILYLPSILPAFALVFIWILFTNPRYGLLNSIFRTLGLPFIDWIGDKRFTKPSLVILAQYGAGNAALVMLASLRSIPRDLYESAEIDGAGMVRKFFNITLPMLTPVILYNIIWGLSAGLQTFTQAFIISSGSQSAGLNVGPSNSLLYYVIYLYQRAFTYSQMGYAAALSFMMFIASMIIAMMVFAGANYWVNYDVE
jgi:multiple sugar transport system permease protein